MHPSVGNAVADGDDGAPFAETRAQFVIFLKTLAEAVEALGDFFVGKTRQRFWPEIHLDAGNDALALERFGEGDAIAGFLADGFVEQNDAADDAGRGSGVKEEHFAIGAAIFLGVGNVDGFEALFDGAETFIGGENAFAFGDERASG